MENILLNEVCKRCAECCKHYPFVELSGVEVNLIEKYTGLNPDVFTNSKGEEREEFFLQFQKNGDCFFLHDNNGSYSCDVYAARPGICKRYPSKPLQIEACDANSEKLSSDAAG